MFFIMLWNIAGALESDHNNMSCGERLRMARRVCALRYVNPDAITKALAEAAKVEEGVFPSARSEELDEER